MMEAEAIDRDVRRPEGKEPKGATWKTWCAEDGWLRLGRTIVGLAAGKPRGLSATLKRLRPASTTVIDFGDTEAGWRIAG